MNSNAPVASHRFFARTGPHHVDVVAAAIGCALPGGGRSLSGLAALENATADQISFIGDSKHLQSLEHTSAGAVLVTPALAHRVPGRSVPLVTKDPAAGWARVAALFHPASPVLAGIHPTAVVDAQASIDATAEIGPHAVIGAGAEIGPRCRIGAAAVIEDGVVLGADCRIGAHATISHSLIGARVHIYPGARIGQEGFGFSLTDHGFVTVPQLGCVVIGDDVEVGANSTIDRGALRDTVIGAGTRLDNLVQVAHGVRIGRYCAVAAQVGISGSVEIDDFVVLGGQAGIADHVHVGAKARVGAQSGVMSEIASGATVVGSPARPFKQVFREIAVLKKLALPQGGRE